MIRQEGPTSDAMWKYINVRRLFIFIEQSIDRGTQWAVFEPNDETTWIAMRSSVTNFLRTVWRNGALMGTTQAEALLPQVRPHDDDAGRLRQWTADLPDRRGAG